MKLSPSVIFAILSFSLAFFAGCVNGIDTDGDGEADLVDQCPLDPNKTIPGDCGCGVAEGVCTNIDTDGDGTPDHADNCPADPKKIETGECGCGFPEDSCSDACSENSECVGTNVYCKKAIGNCEGNGKCAEISYHCDDVWKPVSGCDEKMYYNACYASKSGVSVQCEEQTLSSGKIPDFTHQGTAILPSDIAGLEGNDVIFPSIIRASDYFPNPKGNYYMYFAPHDSGGGGVFLAYADSLDGPWNDSKLGPLFTLNDIPNNDTNHISSPHAIWIPEKRSLYLYLHGPNSTTHLISSKDGINFRYEKVAVSKHMFNEIASECSYARVFRYTIPRYNNKYILLVFGTNKNGQKKIFLAHSKDARDWTPQQNPLVDPETVPGAEWICAPSYFEINGKHYIIYHGDKGGFSNMTTNIYATEVGANFNQMNFVKEVYSRHKVYQDNPRVSDPHLIIDRGDLYLFYSFGKRNRMNIGYAKANLDCQSSNNPGETNNANLALNRPVKVSGTESNLDGHYAVDGNPFTRWGSERKVDPGWIYVDLGKNHEINQAILSWEAAYAKAYSIQVSFDASNWTDVYETTTGDGGRDVINFNNVSARYVRMYGTIRATRYGYSIWEFDVYYK